MKEPIISDLSEVDEEMIKELEVWLENVKSGKWEGDGACPFGETEGACDILFKNLSTYRCKKCPCFTYGQKETILAFTIICDVWKVYHKRGNK